MKNIALIVGLHGDEPFSLEVKEKLSEIMPTFIGNPSALEKGIRYIESDLNRVFPGKEDGNYEEKRAFELMKNLKEFDCVVDLHSSVCNFDLFAILTKLDEKKIEIIKKMGIKKIVLMSEKVDSGASLINNVNCGISLEIGPHNRKENVEDVLEAMKKLINENSGNVDPEIFEVFDILEGERNIKFFIDNFKPVKKGELIAKGKKDYYAESDFIPVFVGEGAYNGVLCFMTKKIS